MKIIAEIIALEKYNDIPNKNIRDIAGFPMITNCLYSIINSTSVSEMHILSNSEDVKKIVATFKDVYAGKGKGKQLYIHDLKYELNDYDVKIHMKSTFYILNLATSIK